MGLNLVSREEWGARPWTREPKGMRLPTPRLWLHHSAGNGTNRSTVRAIQRFHQNTKRWSDIAYSFLVGDEIYEGRGIGLDHLTSDTMQSHAICLLGNYDVNRVPDHIVAKTAHLVAHGILAGWWATGITGGHRDIPGKSSTCPGRYGHAAIALINHEASEIIRGLAAPVQPTPSLREGEMKVIGNKSGTRFILVGMTDGRLNRWEFQSNQEFIAYREAFGLQTVSDENFKIIESTTVRTGIISV